MVVPPVQNPASESSGKLGRVIAMGFVPRDLPGDVVGSLEFGSREGYPQRVGEAVGDVQAHAQIGKTRVAVLRRR